MRTTVTIDDDLWREATRVSQAPTKRALIEQGLKALIDRAACRRAIALAGTLPDIEMPPRRSFDRSDG